MDKVRVGVLGARRGGMLAKYCAMAGNAELVAVCDYNEVFLNKTRAALNDDRIAYDTDFETFIKRDFDAVLLANYATEHVPFVERCLAEGKHVISEVLPCQTLAEAVRLCEAVEKSDRIYAYAENYCYMQAPMEMRRLFREGKLGRFEYGEGEYFHNCEPVWSEITQGNPEHWRNNLPATFYCTHSAGPMIHIAGERPVRVTAFELPFNERCTRMGMKSGAAAVEMVTLANGAVIKSLHGLGISRNSVWFSVYGSKGRMESSREDAESVLLPKPEKMYESMHKAVSRLYTNLDENEGDNLLNAEVYEPCDELTAASRDYGHGGSDYYTMWHFIEKIRGNEKAQIIDVYEALDMGFVGLFGYKSILKGGAPVDIPDFRIPSEREAFRNDTECTNPEKAGAMLIPSYSLGNPEIPKEVYAYHRQKWQEFAANTGSTFSQ